MRKKGDEKGNDQCKTEKGERGKKGREKRKKKGKKEG
jgi:hypothetical protein